MLEFKFSDKQVKELLESLVVIVDSREQVNDHITSYLSKYNRPYIIKKIDSGDYGCYLPKNDKYRISEDFYLPVVVERKNSLNELIGSFKTRERFKNEFERAMESKTRIHLLVEEEEGIQNILKNNYRSEYTPQALWGSIKSFEARYNFTTVFIDKKYSGFWIYYTLYYAMMQKLKEC